MDVRELRIGNWVQNEYYQYQAVAIGSDSGGGYVEYRKDGDEMIARLSTVNPIPLSPEWLERAGFDYEGNGHIWSKNITEDYSLCLTKVSDKYWECWLWDDANGNEFTLNHPDYVHTIQNWWHTFTNEELEFKT